jgi:hypothetical protein
MKKLLVAALLLFGTGNAFAQGETENPEIGDLSQIQTISDPGTIGSSATAYYGPVRSFGAKKIIFFITTADNDSLATLDFEASDDNIKWYASSDVPLVYGSEGTPVSGKNLNGRISQYVISAGTSYTAPGVQPAPDFITARYIKLKLVANGAAISGVAVRTIIVRAPEADGYFDAVYSWTTP